MKMTIIIKKLLLVGEIFFGLILALVIIVSFIPLVPPFKNYYHSRTVLTGSMEPKIPKGSVVINQWLDQKNIKVGDVVTYQHPIRKNIIYITHRIVKIDKTGLLWRFKTKGDANPAADFDLITQVSIEGKVILMIPLIGYLIEFFKTPVGFVLLVAIPLLIFIAQQTRDVLRMWKKPKRRKSAKRKIRKTLVTTLVILCFFSARISFVTYASFTSGQRTITDVSLNTAASFPGDVVINELMWMGSTNSEHLSGDEWIELRNTTENPINLADWKIDGAGSGSNSITLSGTIPNSGFFLISHYSNDHSAINNSITVDQVTPGISLNNGGEQLTLKDVSNNMIDQTPSGAWPQGVNGLPDWKSMERNDTPGDGTSPGSWHTCLADACHSITYWDADDHNWGTPKAANLSENDPTSLSPSPSPSPTPEPSPTPSPALTVELESTSTPMSTPTPEVSSTPTPSPTLEITPTPTSTVEPSPTPEASPTAEPTPSPSPQPIPTASPEPSPTLNPEPTSTPTPTLEATPPLIQQEEVEQ